MNQPMPHPATVPTKAPPRIPPPTATSQQTPEPPPEEPAHPLIRFWRNIRSLVLMILVLFAVRSSIADWNDVPTGSMIPTILDGDRIFVNKLAYDLKVPFTTWHIGHPWADPKSGDIVVFFSPDDGTRLVKRCIAVGGDTIEVQDDHVIINGVPCKYTAPDPTLLANRSASDLDHYDYEMETIGTHTHLIQKYKFVISYQTQEHKSFGPEKVPAGKFFMMGDNRDNSRDSRYFTAGPFVPRDSIVGRATDVVISLNLDNHWIPRWNRFFTRLP